jgi:glycerol-3-phosphate dehydrogenase
VTRVFDLAIIGGGVNGCGIARDAAGRGASVLLCEKSDLGSGTSSASTKLIHGGLRYLEHGDFRLVRHALIEREILWRMAPHIIWPLRFVLPHRKGLRPAWLLRLGLFVYDHLGGRKLLPATRALRLDRDPAGAPLRDVSRVAFEYSDCWVQDNRLVALNARDAAERGADIRARVAVTQARRRDGRWRLELKDVVTGEASSAEASALVNAAGPWIGEVLGKVIAVNEPAKSRLVQGSHIVTRKLYDHDRCYFFQNPDGRIFFAIPYEDDYTLIGTTDSDYVGDPADARASESEIDYLRGAANRYFKAGVARTDVVWSYSGVRSLFDDGASEARNATRDYVLRVDRAGDGAPLLNVFGGKITTYRRLSEEALAALAGDLPTLARNVGWTATAPLPGGDFPAGEADALATELARDHAFLGARRARRLVRHYGTDARTILGQSRSAADLGRDFGGDLSEAEVEHLVAREFARRAEDVVWRRTKSGLRMTCDQIAALEAWLSRRVGVSGPKAEAVVGMSE